MGFLLNAGLLLSGLLLVPPVFLVFSLGPTAGGEELIGKDNYVQADYDSPLLQHVFWLDACRNLVNVLLCFSAVAFFDQTSKKITALLFILLDMLALGVQVVAPVGPGVKPWPSLDGLSINPVVLPIIGGQIVLLTVGLLTSMFESDEKAKKA